MKLAVAVALAPFAFAQPASDKMLSSSVIVFAAVQEKGKPVPVNRAGGFFLDARHVVTNVNDCCARTSKGQQPVPLVVWGEDGAVGKVIWSSDEAQLAILELEKPLGKAAASLAAGKLTQKDQDVYTVQYPESGASGEPKVVTGKLLGLAKLAQSDATVFQTSASLDRGNAGSALFDACGNAIGVNLTMRDGKEYAVGMDLVIDALGSAGVKAPLADQPCGGGASADKGKPGKQEEDGGEEEEAHGWRMPRGTEWIPVMLLLGVVGLALRPATRALSRRTPAAVQVPVPAPAPVFQPPILQKPVLRGVAGEYAGSAVPLDAGPSTLGRDPHAANLPFGPGSSSVSKRHCSVRWDAARQVFVLEDLGSTNGTFLAGGERLNPHLPRDLKPGDRFYIGDLRNQFEVGLEG